MAALDPQLIERFRDDLYALIRETPTPARALGLAVSGGPDSMALLLLAAAAFPGAVRVATVDHGLRAGSDAEAAMVASVCGALSVPHATLRPDCSGDGNLHDRARIARYAALAQWSRGACGWVATAHQRDDLAETLLLRARRGAGLAGMAAMRGIRPINATPGAALIVRPLLGWSRDALAAIVQAAGTASVDDPSNTADRFDRARIRKLLAETDELPKPRLALAARNLRDAEDAVEWMMARLEGARIEANARGVTVDVCDLPHELQRRFVRMAVQRVRQSAGFTGKWRETGIDRLIAELRRGRGATIAEVQASAEAGKWRFRVAPPRRSL